VIISERKRRGGLGEDVMGHFSRRLVDIPGDGTCALCDLWETCDEVVNTVLVEVESTGFRHLCVKQWCV
jgi:hypothetical protein